MRLIDADELKALPFERLIHTDFGETAIPIEEIDNAPTVKIPVARWDCYCEGQKVGYEKALSERPQGEWITNYESQFFNPGRSCSLCGKIVEFSENYCPNCGAQMLRSKHNE